MNRKLAWLAPLVLVACAGPPAKPRSFSGPAVASVEAEATLESLEEGRVVQGFVPVALYLDDDEAPVGARFVHRATNFVLDYLRIESAPQGFLWTTTYPESDKGEPHTQEHLLLGKGNRGRLGANYEHAALAESSAFTAQYRTCYHFHTVASPDAFFGVMENELGMLLQPDYTDEEIRREVRNFGVKKDGDGTLRLEERGSVYNEMVRAYESPGSLAWRAMQQAAYGPRHPLALSSGGFPDALRETTPQDIRRFHAAHYQLSNMGMIGAFPASIPLSRVLAKTGAMLDAFTPAHPTEVRILAERDLPAPAPKDPPGTLHAVDYPDTTADKPGPMGFVWPASRSLPPSERLLLKLFLDAFASDETSVLHRVLVDSKSRKLDTGATGVWSHVWPEPGQPVFVMLTNVRTSQLDEAGLRAVRARMMDELGAIARVAPGSKELAAFQETVKARLVEQRRNLVKLLETPPGFGMRHVGSTWIEHLADLARTPGFRKSLTRKQDFLQIEALLREDGNPWSTRLSKWGLLGVEPSGVALRASPALRTKLDDERKARAEAELARLAARFGTRAPQDTLRRYQAEVDAKTKELEDAESHAPFPPFVATPPMTLDDTLAYEVTSVGPVPLVASRFDTMKSATIGLALRLDAIPERLLVYVPFLPALLRESGVLEGDTAIVYEEMQQRLRKETLNLTVSFDTDLRTRRAELVVRGSGNDVEEARRALEWMGRVTRPNLRADNLPRLRDIAEKVAARARNTMQGPEESWANDPPGFFLRQDDRVLARTASFLTRAHDLHRLRWLLADGGDEQSLAAMEHFFDAFAAAGKKLDRKALLALAREAESSKAAARLSPEGKRLAKRAGTDLAQLLGDVPDETLAHDWEFLCKEMAADLRVSPRAFLADLDGLMKAVLHAESARMDFVGSARARTALEPALAALVAKLPRGAYSKVTYAPKRLIEDRLRERGARTSFAYVGLVNPNTQGGVVAISVPSATYADRGDDALLDFLTANLYAGHGSHGIFMKTWAAGLAYSNGVRGGAASGRFQYYAERCPDVAQTVRFVADTLNHAHPGEGLVDYAVANAFDARTALTFETRAAKFASDLADGITPERVRGFREKLLELRRREHLGEELGRRLRAVYGRVVPGLESAIDAAAETGASAERVRFLIGPPAQLDSFERYLQTLTPSAHVQRLYPRDFWAPAWR